MKLFQIDELLLFNEFLKKAEAALAAQADTRSVQVSLMGEDEPGIKLVFE